MLSEHPTKVSNSGKGKLCKATCLDRDYERHIRRTISSQRGGRFEPSRRIFRCTRAAPCSRCQMNKPQNPLVAAMKVLPQGPSVRPCPWMYSKVPHNLRPAESTPLTCSRDSSTSLMGFPISELVAAPLRASAVPFPTRAPASGTCFVSRSPASLSWALTWRRSRTCDV